MSVELATAYVNLVPSARGFGKATEAELTGQASSTAKAGNKAGIALAGAMAGGFAVAGKGLFASVDFDAQMREVFTLLPGITADAMSQMSAQVKGFATDFGVLPNEVVPALYQSLSAGVPQDNVFEFLETAQQAAKGGATDLTTAVDGITSATNAFAASGLSATEASDLMFTAVKLGKTDFEQLSNSLFNVAPTAAALGVQFGDVTAALAAMTAQGVPTSVATTQMRQLFVELSKTGSKTATVFEDAAGKSFQEFIAAGGNTADALAVLEGAAAESGVSISDLFGSVEAGAAALSLTGANTDSFRNALAEMDEAGGATATAFDTMNGGLRPLIDRFKAFGQVALIWLGDKAVPAIEAVIELVQRNMPQIRAVVDQVREAFRRVGEVLGTVGRWISENRAPVAAFVGVLAGFLIIKTITGAVLALNAALMANPAVLIAVGIAALTAAVVWAYQNVEWFRDAVQAVWEWLQKMWDRTERLRQLLAQGAVAAFEAITKAAGWLWEQMQTVWRVLGDVWSRSENLRSQFATGLGVAAEYLTTLFGALWAAVQLAWEWLGKAWESSETLRSFWAGAFRVAVEVIGTTFNVVRAAIEAVVGIIQAVIEKTQAAIRFVRDLIGLQSQINTNTIGRSGSAAGRGVGSSLGLLGLFGGRRAAGGDMQAGRAYLVGERGRELVVPGVDSAVLSSVRTRMLEQQHAGDPQLPRRVTLQIGGREFEAFLSDMGRKTTGRLA